MEWDLQHYWQTDLRDVFKPGTAVTPRRVIVLYEHLPDTSACAAVMQGGPQFRGWGVDRWLLAGLFNSWSKDPYPTPGGGGRKTVDLDEALP